MQYLALIYSTEGADDVDWETLIQQYNEFGEAASAAGVLVGGNALQPVSTATSVQLRNGEKTMTDVPSLKPRSSLVDTIY